MKRGSSQNNGRCSQINVRGFLTVFLKVLDGGWAWFVGFWLVGLFLHGRWVRVATNVKLSKNPLPLSTFSLLASQASF